MQKKNKKIKKTISSEANIDLIKYCITHMSSKELLYQLYNELKIEFKQSDSYSKLSERIIGIDKIDLELIRKYFRANYKICPEDLHLSNLKSGKLEGHSWHGAMPSMLHLSMQNKVRDCIDGKINIDELIEIGSNIMKHEYFMVAAHDLCESAIIRNFTNTIPPIGSKSISDFVFEGIPYDLKITNYYSNQTKEYVNLNKQIVSKQLLEGADVLRLREQAKKTTNNWGLNRFYVLVENQSRWINDPDSLIEELILEAKKLEKPMTVELEEIKILVQLIAI